MDFASFFKTLSNKVVSDPNSSFDIVKSFKEQCETEQDLLQLYEVKNILSIVPIFAILWEAYKKCQKEDFEPIYDALEGISETLESNSISCFSYSYYLFLGLNYIFNYDFNESHNRKFKHNEELEPMDWLNPNEFDYLKLNSSFGINAETKSKKVEAFPDYMKFVIVGGVLTSYKGTKPYIIIPKDVRSIGPNAFNNNKHIKIVVLGDNVKHIDKGAFANCKKLDIVELGSNITSIPSECFSGCSNLKVVIKAENVNEINEYSFYGCKKLNHVTFKNLTKVGNYAFANCSEFDNDSIITNLTQIGNYAFEGCKLNYVALSNCTKLGHSSFANCKDIQTLVIESNLSKVGLTPFYGCNKIVNIVLTSEPKYRIFDLVNKNEEETNHLSISNVVVRKVTPYLFQNLVSLQHVSVNGKTNIGDHAFEGCENLVFIDFENKNISSIGDYAFARCYKLAKLDINFTSDKIGEASFYKCLSLKDFSFLKNVTSFGSKALAYDDLTNFDFSKSNFKHIGSFAFANAKYPEELNICFNNTELSYGIFHGVKKINAFEISGMNFSSDMFYALFERSREEFNQNVSINYLKTDFIATPSAFKGLNAVYIECQLEKDIVPYGLFENCKNLKSVSIKGIVSTIGSQAFAGCSNLEYIATIFNQNVEVKSRAFIGCRNLDFEFLDRLTIIHDEAFMNTGLSKLELTNKTTFIGDGAFAHCPIKGNITLPFIGNCLNSDKPLGVIFGKKDDDFDCLEQKVDSTTYTIPKDVDSITCLAYELPDKAFEHIDGIKIYNLPNVAKLEHPIFIQNKGIEDINIGKVLKDLSLDFIESIYDPININIDEDNKNFASIDGHILSKDGKELYYSPKGDIPESVKVIKSYAIKVCNNILILEDFDLIESNAINVYHCQTIKFKDVKRIEKHAFYSLSSDVNVGVDLACEMENPIFRCFEQKAKINELSIANFGGGLIDALFNVKVDYKNIVIEDSLLNGAPFGKSDIDSLTIIDSRLDKIDIPNINTLNLVNCNSLKDCFENIQSIKTLNVKKDTIFANELDGMSFNELVLDNCYTIEENAFNNASIQKLSIYNTLEIAPGAFFNSNIKLFTITSDRYEFKDNILTIDGIALYVQRTSKNINIPNYVTHILKHAIDLHDVDKIQIRNNIIYDKKCFYNNSKIKTITCEQSNLECLQDGFNDELNIKEIEYIGNDVPEGYLNNLSTVERIVLEDTIESIADFAFANDTSLINVVNMEKASYYGNMIFDKCHKLTNPIFNPNAKHIGFKLFRGCNSLVNIEMPLPDYYQQCEYSFEDVFDTLESNPSITITNGNVPSHFFENRNNQISIKYDLKVIEDAAFKNAPNVSIDLRNTVSIGKEAFINNNVFTKLNLVEIEEIKDHAFANCDKLVSVTFGSKLKEIGNNIFDQCDNIKTVGVQKDNPLFRAETNALIKENEIIYYPPKSSDTRLFLSNLNKIKTDTFKNCFAIKEVVLQNVNSIETKSFDNCINISSISIIGNNIDIDKHIFTGINNLDKFNIANIAQGKIKTLTDYFKLDKDKSLIINKLSIYGAKLTSNEISKNVIVRHIELSNEIKVIPDEYFKDCMHLESINIPNSCTRIGNASFKGCTALSLLDGMPCNVQEYGDNAFALTNLDTFIFSDLTKKIGKDIFKDTKIKKLVFNNNLKSFNCKDYGLKDSLVVASFNEVKLEPSSFENNINLLRFEANKIIDNIIPNSCFKNCNKLARLVIKNGIEVIQENAFEDCKDLVETPINDKVTLIKKEAFKNCNSLLSITIPNECKLEENCFLNCNKISKIKFNNKEENFKLSNYGFNPKTSGINTVVFDKVSLEESAFEDFAKLNSFVANSVKTAIPKRCFKNCNVLNSVSVASIETIGDEAFMNCKLLSLNNLLFKDIKEIGNKAFFNCEKIATTISLDNITKLGHSSFEGCLKLKDVKILGRLKEIPTAGFKNTNLKSISVPSSLAEIKNEAFALTRISKLKLPMAFKKCGKEIFSGLTNSVVIYVHDKNIVNNWDKEWNKGLIVKHKFLKFLNPEIKVKEI